MWYNKRALDEVARMFGYNDGREPENFEGGYCMDCGVYMGEIVKTYKLREERM